MNDDDLFEQTRRRLALIEELAQQVRADAGAEAVDTEEDFARRARAGELGRDWQVLQGRIDLGETSLAAVFDGSDDSTAAHGVREAAHVRVGLFAEEVRAAADADGEPDPIAELGRERERLLSRGAALRERLAALADDTERMPR